MFELKQSITIDAPIEKVFNAFTSAEALKQWFAPGDAFVAEASCDFVVGGQYRIVMRGKETGEDYIVAGHYQVIEENSRIIFTWKWDFSPRTTLVEFTFEAVSSNQTTLFLHHAGFAELEYQQKHGEGWQGCLESLANTLLTQKA
ncbi:SRPBCC family protein [Thalassotalea agarivorans]|uniref:Uncharacterized conserved protein YndB, AHSA1/START domain n=1 Tax=Thalassotalea agarivorans TaxID=349064 RepID=A0A1I0AKD3_THASX|nr:SRPBCC domain-containing protein [Thalassotalea agarivorans]SES94309.1 Uncharacterized conserved protein YndB, AHSA1/START domain [Thalassotalea agarivorans]